MSEVSATIWAWLVILVLPPALVVAIYAVFVPLFYGGKYPTVKTWAKWLRLSKQKEIKNGNR